MFAPGFVLAAGLLTAASSAASAAQDPQVATVAQDLKRLSLEELANLEVTTVNKQPEQVLNTAAAVYVITGDDIRRSGATTLPDVLRLAPGVTVSQSDANRWAVGIRGFADIFSKNVLVLIDGRSVYTPLVGGVHWAIQDVFLGDVDRIEVIRGPGASVWGANAVNGVINVITRPAGETTGLRVAAAAGTVEHARVSGRYGWRAGKADYRVYGKAFDRGAQFHVDAANFDDWRSMQGGFRADWRPGEHDTVTLSGDAYRTDVGERAEVSGYEPPSFAIVDDRIDLTGGNVIAAWQHLFADGARLRLQAFYDRTNRRGFTFGEVRTTWDVDANIRFAPAGRHRLSVGGNGRVSPSTVRQVIPTLNFVPQDHTFKIASGFIRDEFTLLGNRLSVGAGVRAEYNSYTGTELLPSISGVWTPAASRRFWADVTRAVRTPSRFERDLDFQVLVDPGPPVYLAVAGNPDFENESSVGVEFGYRELLRSNLYVDVVLFDQSYDGLAALGAAQVGAAVTPVPHVRATLPFVNGVDGSARGIEVAPDWRPTSFWRLAGSYSYVRLSLQSKAGVTDPSSGDIFLGRSPTHQVRVQSRMDLTDRLTFDQTYRYVSRLRTGAVPAYHALDARAAWDLTPRIQVAIVGQNLLDPRHPELGAVPVQIRRSGYVQLLVSR